MENENIERKTPFTEKADGIPVIQQPLQKGLPTKQKKEALPYERPENLSDIEKAIIYLTEELENLTELRDAIEHNFSRKEKDDANFKNNFTREFNSLKETLDSFGAKLQTEFDSRAELEAKQQAADYSRQVYLLEQELQKEREKITFFIDDLTKWTQDTLQKIEGKCSELKSAEQQINDAINKFRNDSLASSESEYRNLKVNSEAMLRSFTESAQKTLETVKKTSIDFLKECEKENKNLIAKVPSVNDKSKSIVNWIVIAFGVLGLASFIASLFIR